ncbi:hypothetical protein ACE6H2_022870 [Prunus campanulata]
MRMEDIAWNLKPSEVKQRSLGKAHETLRAQADSMVQFSVQWKELEDLFDSTRNSLQIELQELQELKKEIDCRLADFETKELNFNLVMGAKAKQLQGIVQEVEESNSQLQSFKLSIQEHCEKYEVEENRLGKVQKLVKGKEMKYFSIQQRIKDVSKEIESKSKEIESKERQLNDVQGKVVDQRKEFDLKDKEIIAKQTLIEESDREMKSKEQKPGLIHKLMLEYSNAIESKIKDFNLLEKSVGVWDCKLELRELEIKRWFVKLEKQFDSKVEELNLIDKRVKDCINEVQLKEKLLYPREKHLDSLDKSIQECARRLEQQAKELELKQQQFEKSTEEEEHTRKKKSKEKADTLHSQLECILNNNAVVPSPTNNQSSIIRDGRSLQVFMNEYFRTTDRVSAEVSTGLHVSSDPAKLVLDAMQGFYTSNSTVGNREFGFDLSVIRRSCIHLLKVSPEINDQVREEAKKLAGDWKAKMIVVAENWLEVLGYLWLLTAYDLASTYDVEELQTLRGIAAEHELPAERCGILDMAVKAPADRRASLASGGDSSEEEVGRTTTVTPSSSQPSGSGLDPKHKGKTPLVEEEEEEEEFPLQRKCKAPIGPTSRVEPESTPAEDALENREKRPKVFLPPREERELETHAVPMAQRQGKEVACEPSTIDKDFQFVVLKVNLVKVED